MTEKKQQELTKKRARLLNILFPGHGEIFSVCDGLNLDYLGLVDFKRGLNYLNSFNSFNGRLSIEGGFWCGRGCQIGKEAQLNAEGLARFPLVEVGEKVWICGGVKILPEKDFEVESGCVLTPGSVNYGNYLPQNACRWQSVFS